MKSFSKTIIKWYNDNNYDFPFRGDRNPYKIWLSECMLQQTRLSIAVPYYNKWLDVLPDIQSVAKAELDDILKLWEGLGYYARARNFYKACIIVVEKYGGIVPHNLSEFSKLPGVGPYIASAVMSIAFNMPVPTIDGNTIRVVSRINSINLPYPRSRKDIYSMLEKHIDRLLPGDFNQAIMDLGREICRPLKPLCNICPIHMFCNSFVNSSVDKYPIRMRPILKRHYNVAVGIIWNKDKILISKRKPGGLLGGLWEFPGGKIEKGECASECVVREVQEELGICVHTKTFLSRIKHSYTHFSITLDAFSCEYLKGEPRALGCDSWRWIYLNQIKNFAFPAACHKLFQNIKKDVRT